jgi:hypothetical protein
MYPCTQTASAGRNGQKSRSGVSKTRIDRLGFEGENTKGAFVNASQGLVAGEALESFDTESEFAEGERALSSQATGAQPVQMFGKRIFGTVYDSEILAPATFYGGLHDAAPALLNEIKGLNYHALAAALRVLGPPSDGLLLTIVIHEIDLARLRVQEKTRLGGA